MGGNDANNGTSFAQRVKTITTGVASKYAAGDTVRVAASNAPLDTGIQATWTVGTRAVTLASSLTQKIWLGGDGNWTASANVTCTGSTTRKSQAGNSSSIAIASAFTTGLAAFFATGTLDLSAYRQVSFWIQVNAAVASGVLRIDLCSDVSGATPVNSVTINLATVSGNSNITAGGAINRWIPVTLDSGGALGSSIKSVALFCISDPGTVTVLLDNIIACKAPGAGCITLQSLVGKNYANNVDTWYGIGTINGTALILDGATSVQGSQASTVQGYAGTAEVVELWTRETIKLPAITVGNQVANGTCEPAKTGTVSAPVTFSFGWDQSAMTSQSGETWFDGLGGLGAGLTVAAGINWINTDLFCGFVRFGVGVVWSGTNSTSMCAIACNNNETTGFANNSSGSPVGGVYYSTVNFCNNNGSVFNGSGTGMTISTVVTLVSGVQLCGNGLRGFYSGTPLGTRMYGYLVSQNVSAGCQIATNAIHVNCTFSANTTDITPNGVSSTGVAGVFVGCSFSSATLLTTPLNEADRWVYLYDIGGVVGTNAAYSDGVTVTTSTPRVAGAGTFSWLVTFNNNGAQNRNTATYPVRWQLNNDQPLWCKANQLVTWKVWVQVSASTVVATLTVPGGQLTGVPNAVTAAANSSLVGNWQLLSVTFTPTVDGPINAYVYTYGTVLSSYCLIDETETKPHTDPGVANVLSTVSYNFNGALETGTYVAAANTNVKTGVAFGVADTGTYDGSDRWSDPGIATVLSGQAYKANSTSNNRTGTLDIAASVWNALKASYVTAGSFGKLLNDNLDAPVSGAVAPTASAVADAVWNRLTSAITTGSSIGKLLVDNVNATISSRLASGSYTAPDNSTITTINTKIGTPASSVSADIAAVKTDVDALPTAATTAAAVWEVDISSHTTKTKFGGFAQTLLSVSKFLGLK